MGKSKKKIIPDYLKKAIKGTTIGSGIDIYDDENVISPKGSFSIGKGNTSISGSVEKPYLKKSKDNINSTISLGLTKESDKGSLSLQGSKTGKSKNLSIFASKTFNKGGDTKIKKVIKGLHKASALHKGQAKSLETVIKKSGGGVARGTGAAIRGKGFQGVF